jgi:hypothetical protein
MRAHEHAASGDVAGTVARLRRCGALALATFAALLTLVLPAPAFARPASTTGGTIASTGAGATSGSPAGRRTHRVEVSRTSRSLNGRAAASTRGGLPSAEVNTLAHVAGVSHGGPVLTAALPATVRATASDLAVGDLRRDPGSLRAAAPGACGSRAPPGV